MRGTFPLFQFKGIPFKAHWTFPLFLVFHIFRDSNPQHFRWNLAFAVILVFTVIIHELGHALAARSVGGRAHQIVLWPLGGLAYTSGHGSLEGRLKTTLAGPATHIPLALLFAGAATAVEGRFDPLMFSPWYGQVPATSLTSAILMMGVKVQVILFLINMFIPAYPLDCGHAIIEVMLLKGKKPETAAKVMVGLSMVAGLVLLLYFQMWIIAAFIFYNTWQLHSLLQTGRLAQHPLFNQVMNRSWSRPKPRPKHLSLVKKKADKKTCPDCGKSVNPGALMCGFCEKELPK